ncbi:uncharacterized protein LOC123293331 isoform X3 [Chrysoperla carnea]|uniref:uncharacterized protein LOC123293331 isoform X3 n=1 Tax=Chrysoperla carnea TaxID=189513 RepID=UPI001D08353B|nr:uncharacterized protein LOC123293331 isoform X3 [Chrysoperla carnea]
MKGEITLDCIKAKMDNAGFEQDTRATEMRDVSITLDKSRLNGHNPPSTSAGTSCRPEACLAARKKYLAQGPQSADQSPWHRQKTIYLFTVITLLIIWVIVYSSLHVNGIL